MDSICRLCSSQSPSLTSVFSFRNERIVADMITIICPIRISLNDEHPKSICSSCLNIISDAVELREKSLRSDENFKAGCFVPAIKIKTEVDPFHREVWLEDETGGHVEDENSGSSDESPSGEMDEDWTMDEIWPKEEKRLSSETPSKTSCNLCGLQLSHATNVKRHMLRYHNPALPFPCDKCTCRFNTEARLRTHYFKTHDLPLTKVQKIETKASLHQSNLCDFCGKDFASRSLLERHLTISHRSEDLSDLKLTDSNFIPGSYPCKLCDKTFTMRHNLNRHHKRFHSDDLTFQCLQCNDRFKTEVHLSRHVTKVHENRDGIFNKRDELDAPCEVDIQLLDKCKFCEAEFNGSKYRYERHMLIMHEEEVEKVYSCDICPKTFIFIKSLKHHVEVHRKRAREETYFPFQCSVCLRKFLSEEKYQHHVTYSHDESSPNICHLCGESFASRQKYNYHMMKHQNIRNYQCEECGHKFYQAKNLKRHMATHSNVRPFVCSSTGCEKSFKYPDDLKKHERKFHGIN